MSRERGLPPCRYFTMQEERWKTPKDGHFPAPGPGDYRAFRLASSSGGGDGGLQGRLQEEGEGGEEGEGKLTLPVHLLKARVAKGASRFRAMSHVMIPVRTHMPCIRIYPSRIDPHNTPTHDTIIVTPLPPPPPSPPFLGSMTWQMEYRFESKDPRALQLHYTSAPLTSPLEVRETEIHQTFVRSFFLFLPPPPPPATPDA